MIYSWFFILQLFTLLFLGATCFLHPEVCMCVCIHMCMYTHTHTHTVILLHINLTHTPINSLTHSLTSWRSSVFSAMGSQLSSWSGLAPEIWYTKQSWETKMRCLCGDLYVINSAHETAICHNPQNSRSWNFLCTRQLGYKHTCQNAVFTKIIVHPYIFVKM